VFVSSKSFQQKQKKSFENQPLLSAAGLFSAHSPANWQESGPFYTFA
jgi:hypothetical protein